MSRWCRAVALILACLGASACFRTFGRDPLAVDGDAGDAGAGDADRDVGTAEDAAADGGEDADVDGSEDADVDGSEDADVDGSEDADVGGIPVVPGVDLALAWDHSCVVFGDRLACFGSGEGFALGQPDEEPRFVPVLVGGVPSVAAVSAGTHVTCALLSDRTVRCFGANGSGQLGVGTRESSATPTPVALAGPVRSLAAGFGHVCAVLEDGALWCWGRGAEGELGQSDPWPDPAPDHLTPVEVDVDGQLLQGACTGMGHTCALTALGALYCWGANLNGELGLGDGAPGQTRAPARVGARTDWAEVVCGQEHTCALTAGGELWCWGLDGDGGGLGPLGLPASGSYAVPTRVGAASDWTAVATDTFHSCGLRGAGELYCWGRNAEGQLGTGDILDSDAPLRIGSGSDWARVDVGRFHTCAQRRDGTTLCTGKGETGELGDGGAVRRRVLTPIAVLGSE